MEYTQKSERLLKETNQINQTNDEQERQTRVVAILKFQDDKMKTKWTVWTELASQPYVHE